MTDPRMTPTNDAPVTVDQEAQSLEALSDWLLANDHDMNLPDAVAHDPRDIAATLRRLAALASAPAGDGLDMILHCPVCGVQHIDEPSEGWDNPPHRSHLCLSCGHIWRPADVPTNGVGAIKTKGTADSGPVAPLTPDVAAAFRAGYEQACDDNGDRADPDDLDEEVRLYCAALARPRAAVAPAGDGARPVPQAWIDRAMQIEAAAGGLVSMVNDAIQRAKEGTGRLYAANIGQLDKWAEQVLEAINLPEPVFPAALARPRAAVAIDADMLGEVMQDAWGEICDDAGTHPSDMTHGRGSVLFYSPNHWTRLIAMRLSERLNGPRAAVGEREAALEAALKRAAVNMTNTPRHNRGSVQDRHIGAAREEIRLALQSPPAKVEGAA